MHRLRYGIEIDADRTEQAQSLDIATLQADENGRALPGRLSFVPALPTIGLASRTPVRRQWAAYVNRKPESWRLRGTRADHCRMWLP